jgi:hypothetical protein
VAQAGRVPVRMSHALGITGRPSTYQDVSCPGLHRPAEVEAGCLVTHVAQAGRVPVGMSHGLDSAGRPSTCQDVPWPV